MPILQNKLVIKSIEALHDEALALVPDTDSYRKVSAPTISLHNNTPPQESPINVLKNTSADSSPEPSLDQNIMARIDNLLKKLDENEDVAIAPPSEKGPNPNAEDPTVDAFDNSADSNSNEMSDDGKKDEKPRPDQTRALADIAEAIYQAQHQEIDNVAKDAIQNSSIPFDMDSLSATVADEVRRTVSAVMSAELPHLVRNAIGEELRALPANTFGQLNSVIGKQSAAKTNAARETAANIKSEGKKTRNKKTTAKNTSIKTSTKKLQPKKAKTKATAKTKTST